MFDYSFSFEDMEIFLLIVVRMASFVVTAPFFSINNVPRRFKAGFSIFMAMIIYAVMPVHTPLSYNTVYGYAALVLLEAMTGLILGIGANLIESTVHFAGKLADMEIGLSMVQVMDPATRQMTGFTGIMYQYIVSLMMIISGMHHYFIRAMAETYRLIPLGGAVFDSEDITLSIIIFLRDYMNIAFRLCLPVVVAIMLVNVVLGILAKSAPQINMFSVGVQIKIFAGFAILFITVSTLPNMADYIFREMRLMMTTFTEIMGGS
ncbi:MAG TPA: flagellar biosynthetic protein FliR [Lachnospiraceae bacterium]|nr:flagellar biosynthetic protein FliR [Lachnospiraceae bacterium]